MKNIRIRYISYIVFILLFHTYLFSQTEKNSCDCPKNDHADKKADTTFFLTNGKTIVLCGFKNPETNPQTYSGFVLAICGIDSIIDSWDEIITCKLETKKDTLLVEQLEYLPVGKNFEYLQIIWTTEKIYFMGDQIHRKKFINRHIPKYNKKEISKVLKEFENFKDIIENDTTDKLIKIMDEIFVATISGDKTAREYFDLCERKFKLDGYFSENYHTLRSMLKAWDKED